MMNNEFIKESTMQKALQRNGITYPVTSYRALTYVQAPINYALYLHYSPSLDDIDQKSMLWQEMYLLARDKVTCYFSDFYWDCWYLDHKKLNQSFTFCYLYGESGTTIVDKPDRYRTVEQNALACRQYSRPFVYRVELVKPEKECSQQWPVFFTCLATEECGVLDYRTNSYNVLVSGRTD